MQTMRIININILTMGTIRFSESFIPNSVYTQCIRWKRKPIWLPPSKSKLFHVPKRPVIPIEESEELKRLNNNYRTYMTSLRSYITKTYLETKKIQFDEAVIKQLEEEDFQKCNAINDEWNAEIAKQREIRLTKMRQSRKEFILNKLKFYEKRKRNLKDKIDNRIKKAKEEASTFITAENVDAAIEKCLEDIIDHNRALDLEGKWQVEKYLSTSSAEQTQNSINTEQ